MRENTSLQVTGNRHMKVAAYESFDELIEAEKMLPTPRSFSELINADSRQFGLITQTYGSGSLISHVSAALVKTCQFMNFEITGGMIAMAARLIVDKYPLCKLADLKMFELFILAGNGEKRYRLDTRELCQMFDDYIQSREEAFEEIRIAEKKKIERDTKIDDEKEYAFFVAKYAERLKSDWNASDKSLTYDEFCRMKYAPVENPTPIDYSKVITRKLYGIPIRDLAAREGRDYDDLLRKESKHWQKQYGMSGVTDELTFEDYTRYRKIVFDNQLRKELEQ